MADVPLCPKCARGVVATRGVRWPASVVDSLQLEWNEVSDELVCAGCGFVW